MSNIVSALQWRYATKQFDATKKLSPEQLATLLEAMRLSASSFGLQPWKFIVVSNPAVREQLKAAAYGQPQVTDASHLIVLAAKTNLGDANADEFVADISKTRQIPIEGLAELGTMLKGSIARRTPEQNIEWAKKQCYIALGTLLSAAALEHIDAGGMEGFDAAKFDEILGLPALNLTTAVIAPVGFRSETDPTAKMAKVRFPKSEVVVEVK